MMPMAMSKQESLPFPSEPLLYLKPGTVGYFSLLVKTPDRMRQDSFPMRQIADVIMYVDKRRDTYITPNQYIRKNRRLVNLWQLNTLFTDADTYKIEDLCGLSPEQLAFICLDRCSDERIPIPSLILFTGRGLQVKWILDKPIPRQALPRWNAVQRVITNKLRGIGADQNSIDGSRVLRLDHTVNTKTQEITRVVWPERLDSPITYDFELLCNEILPYPRRDNPPRFNLVNQSRFNLRYNRGYNHGSAPAIFTAQSLNWLRLEDIRRLVYLRGWTHGNPDGMRDPFIYFGAIFASWVSSGNALFWESESLGREFAPHWSKDKLLNKIGSYFRMVETGRRYRLTNNRLLEVLQITPEEERQLRTIISHTEKANRRRMRLKRVTRMEYEARARGRRLQAIDLKQNGKSYKEIALTLGVTVRHAIRLIEGRGGSDK